MSKKVGLFLAMFLLLAAPARASEGFDDLVKLIKSGIGEDVQIAYVDTSKVSFDLTPDEILYLKDLGVSEKLIAKVMQRGKTVRDGAPAVAQAPAAELPPLEAPNINDELAAAELEAEFANEDLPPLPEKVPELPLIVPQASNAFREYPDAPAITRVGGDVSKSSLLNDPDLVDPVIGRPEVVRDPVRPADEFGAPERDVVEREVIVEKPVYVDRPVYIERTVVTAPPADRVDETLFYEALSPYGRWVEVEDAWYWQPTVVTVERGWKPYSNRGHWVYTDHGWTWQSDYSWGWAAFHYGRWDNHPRYGWIWHPDNVWGPAWVSWRSNDRYAGWAPLPRHAHYESGIGFSFRGRNVGIDFNFGLSERDYCFVPVDRVHDHRVYDHRVRPSQVTNVYNNTTVINNTYVYNDNRIINNGIPVARVQEASRTEIKPTRIVDAPIRSGERITNNHLQRDGLAVYRPQVAAASAKESPRVVLARREAEFTARENTKVKATAALKPTNATSQARPGTFERDRDVRRTEDARKPVADTRRNPATTTTPDIRRRTEDAAPRSTPAEPSRTTRTDERANDERDRLRGVTTTRTVPQPREVEASRTGTGNARDMVMEAQRKKEEAEKLEQARRATQANNDTSYEAQRRAEAAAERRRDSDKRELDERARLDAEARKQRAVIDLRNNQQAAAEENARREQARKETQARNDAAIEGQRRTEAASASAQARRDSEQSAREAATERLRGRPQSAPQPEVSTPRVTPPSPIRRPVEDAPRAREERRPAPTPAPKAPAPAPPPRATPAPAPVPTPGAVPPSAKSEADERRERLRGR